MRTPAAIDFERLAGDEIRIIRDEKADSGTKSEARKVNKKVTFCSLQNFFLVIYFTELVTAN